MTFSIDNPEGGCNNPPLRKYVREKPSGEQGLRYTPRKWVSYSQEILRHGSQFLSKKGEKILREVGRISRNLWGGGSQIRFDVENPDRSGSQFAKIMKNIWIAPPPEHYAVTFCFFYFFL